MFNVLLTFVGTILASFVSHMLNKAYDNWLKNRIHSRKRLAKSKRRHRRR
ncbi:hypothetical protein [Lactobacillus acidophilus]|nr:hypothetical protein [Lactobacillus acidophilus]CDF70788.1 Hypothetical cytosolic protein [Lactobacillus acidophilus CIRM-BIA 445]MBA4558102.1 hypothetical protein [Lactobacillus acidophilus]MBN3461829.1 hypothetical protein [Lactobacillus acidophilus]MBN3466270.1 hypothetical protein [Lactobacillus acidophilus]MBN3480245.1 hypothetical protein [Lactobacillus acidophilus]